MRESWAAEAMLPDDTADLMRLLYLAVLLAGIVGFGFAGRRLRLRQLRDLAVWLLILAMLVIAYGFRDTLQSALYP
jgi:hypothetical protein